MLWFCTAGWFLWIAFLVLQGEPTSHQSNDATFPLVGACLCAYVGYVVFGTLWVKRVAAPFFGLHVPRGLMEALVGGAIMAAPIAVLYALAFIDKRFAPKP